jgi:hypothetical protein
LDGEANLDHKGKMHLEHKASKRGPQANEGQKEARAFKAD